jgi:hypothetical protein
MADSEEEQAPVVEEYIAETTAAAPEAVAEAFAQDGKAQEMAGKMKTELRRQEKRRSYHKRKRDRENPFEHHRGHRSTKQKVKDIVTEAKKPSNLVYVAGGLGVVGLVALAIGLR